MRQTAGAPGEVRELVGVEVRVLVDVVGPEDVARAHLPNVVWRTHQGGCPVLVLKKGFGVPSVYIGRSRRAPPRPAADLGPEAVVGGGAVHRDHAEHELAEVDAAVRVQVEGLRLRARGMLAAQGYPLHAAHTAN